MGDGVYVGAFGYLEGGEGVTEAVEGDVLGDASILQPILERFLGVVTLEVLEDESGAWLAAEFIGLLRQGKGGLCVGLLGLDADAPASVLRFYDVAPIEGEYVAILFSPCLLVGLSQFGFRDGLQLSSTGSRGGR